MPGPFEPDPDNAGEGTGTSEPDIPRISDCDSTAMQFLNGDPNV